MLRLSVSLFRRILMSAEIDLCVAAVAGNAAAQPPSDIRAVSSVKECRPDEFVFASRAGKWAHLAFGVDARAAVPEWLPANSVIFEEVKDVEHASMFSGLKAILIRPDGYVAQSEEEHHVGAA